LIPPAGFEAIDNPVLSDLSRVKLAVARPA
jgi:hypothetical protein